MYSMSNQIETSASYLSQAFYFIVAGLLHVNATEQIFQ